MGMSASCSARIMSRGVGEMWGIAPDRSSYPRSFSRDSIVTWLTQFGAMVFWVSVNQS